MLLLIVVGINRETHFKVVLNKFVIIYVLFTYGVLYCALYCIVLYSSFVLYMHMYIISISIRPYSILSLVLFLRCVNSVFRSSLSLSL